MNGERMDAGKSETAEEATLLRDSRARPDVQQPRPERRPKLWRRSRAVQLAHNL
jgi:hypothetical protein